MEPQKRNRYTEKLEERLAAGTADSELASKRRRFGNLTYCPPTATCTATVPPARAAQGGGMPTTAVNYNGGTDVCAFFARSGECPMGDQCHQRHDQSTVRVCNNWLLQKCDKPNCKQRHERDYARLPYCKNMKEKGCTTEGCPFAHVNHLSPDRPICVPFNLGYCPAGVNCVNWHLYEHINTCSLTAAGCYTDLTWRPPNASHGVSSRSPPPPADPSAVPRSFMHAWKEICQNHARYGICKAPSCDLVHDPSYVGVCVKWLRGKCDTDGCLLRHEVDANRTPYCTLKGCVSVACPFVHSKLDSTTPTCSTFEHGFCPNGINCSKRHCYTTPSRGGKGADAPAEWQPGMFDI